MKKLSYLLVSTFVVLGLTVSTAHADVYGNYQISKLGSLEYSRAWAINNFGTIGGESPSVADPGIPRAAFWRQGAVSAASPNAADSSVIYGMNDFGTGVGRGQFADSVHNAPALMWRNNVQTILPGLNPNLLEQNDYAFDVNNFNTAVGYSGVNANGTSHAVVWKNGNVTDLSPGAVSGGAFGINDAGTVVGNINSQATVWRNNVPTTLSIPVPSYVPANASIYSNATGINANGDIVGYVYWTANNDARQSRYAFLAPASGPVKTFSGIPGYVDGSFTNCVAYGLNSFRAVVGDCYNSDGKTQGFYWNGNTTQALGSLDTANNLSSARSINNAGTIVGYAEDENFIQYSVIWKK